MIAVVVTWDFYNEIHKLGGLNNRHLFLTVLEAGESEANIGSGERSFPGLQTVAFLLYLHIVKKESFVCLFVFKSSVLLDIIHIPYNSHLKCTIQ